MGMEHGVCVTLCRICHRERGSKAGPAWCTGMRVNHCRESRGSVGPRGARWRGCVCGGAAVGDGVDVCTGGGWGLVI